MPTVELDQYIPRAVLSDLLEALKAQGYRCVGPQVQDGAVLFNTLNRVDDLPHGYRDAQSPGHYRVERTSSSRLFAWAVGPQGLKPFLFAPEEPLWVATPQADGALTFRETLTPSAPLAFIGARACDLAALRLLDAHFLQGPYPDAHYARRRAGLFVVAVNCSDPASTCFCASTGDGPVARDGFDLVLTELEDGYLIGAGSTAGEALLTRLATQPATAHQQAVAQDQAEQARTCQQRALPAGSLQAPLFERLEHPHWADVASRCLSCGNCTSVCPTCFCSSEVQSPGLEEGHAVAQREWSSCFSSDHAWLAGHAVRPDTRTRYRQWMTHKLGSWETQYGRSGCVGCGRCITWCPTGIDLVAEVHALLAPEASDHAG